VTHDSIKYVKKTSFEARWETIKPFSAASGGDDLSCILTLHVARLATVFLVTCLWVAFTLSTGHLTVVFVVLLGVAIGCTQFFMPKGMNRFYLPSAFMLTLLGGIISNVLAGLAFSAPRWASAIGRFLMLAVSLKTFKC